MLIFDEYPNASWRRFHDDPNAPSTLPQRRYYPGSRADLIEIVQTAEGMPSPEPEVRACGSHWALSSAAMTEGFVIETSDPDNTTHPRLNRTLYNIVPGCMTPFAIRFLYDQDMPPFDPAVDPFAPPNAPPKPAPFYLYHVECGKRIYELYCELDGGDNRAGSLARIMYSDFEATNFFGPWAMATLGGAGGQTIVGAFNTGTHGGDVGLPPIADVVQAIHLIGPQGKEYWLERPLGNQGSITIDLVDDNKLQSVYPGIAIIRDPDVFNSVLVSAGRMGIIYSVVLRVVRQYALAQNVDQSKWSYVRTWIDNPLDQHFSAHRFVQIVVNPYADENGDYSCFITSHDSVPLAQTVDANGDFNGQLQRCGPGNAGQSAPLGSSQLWTTMCESNSPLIAAINSIIGSLLEASFASDIICAFFGDPFACAFGPIAASAISLLGALEITLPSGNNSFGETLTTIVDWCASQGSFGLGVLSSINDFVLNSQLSSVPGGAISYAILDGHSYLDKGCTQVGDSLEVFFDASSTAIIAFIEKIIERVQELANGTLTGGQPAGFTGYISLRFMQASSGLIAMQKWPHTCSMEIAGVLGDVGTEPLLNVIEQDAIDAGGTVHWGQRNSLTMIQTERAYDPAGPLLKWRNALSAFTENGRLTTFSTNFTRRCGLEIVQPQVQEFSVSPTFAAAGSQIVLKWDAWMNPPGTIAELSINTSGINTPLIPANPLVGTMHLQLPLGISDISYRISYLFNGRTLVDSRTIQVHGLQTGDVIRDVASADCVSNHWTRMLTFSANDYSAGLTVEALAVQFLYVPPGSTWTASKAGMAPLVFSLSQMEHTLTAPGPTLRGQWTFSLDTLGCLPPQPVVRVGFRLASA